MMPNVPLSLKFSLPKFILYSDRFLVEFMSKVAFDLKSGIIQLNGNSFLANNLILSSIAVSQFCL
ncbi:Uncharacterised protein [Chlamydia trachomatis]|nr:Uncharacterised protein [Chlamydia trachomatis]